MAKVLSYEKCKHFYELRDALADFAYEKLDIEGRLYIGKGKKFSDDNLYNEDTLADTLDELWSKPDVLDDFVNSNPAKLSDADLAIVRSWHSSLQGWFTVFKQNGKLFFLNRKRIFEVGGLLEEIDDVLGNPEYPVVVETTLLPFEEGIVYYGFMKRLPVSMGEGIRKMIDSEIEEALQDEQIFTTAEDFIKIAPKIKEEKMKEKVENTEREAALAEQGRRQMQGFHKGVLSGMSENEREEAVDAEIRNAVADSTGLRESLIERIKGGTNGGRVTRDLEKLISKEPKPKLLRWAIVLGIDIPSEVKKPALIQALLPELSRNPFLPSLTLHAGFNLKQFEAYRRLFEAGGLLEFAENEIETISGIPSATSLICYSFYTKGASKKGGKFTFVIPDDIMEVLDGLDWDEIREHLQSREAAADIAEAVSDLRGLARADDVYDEFCRFYHSSLSSEGFEEAVKDAIIEDRIGCVWLEADDGNSYLINYELAGLCREDDNPEEVKVAYKDYAIIRGKLEPLGFIIEEQKKKRIRPLEKNMLSSRAVFDWKCSRPAVRAVRDYLDENVPNSQNDYFFADAVIEELVDYMSFGLMDGSSSVRDWLEILEEHDYIPDEGHLNRIIRLLTNMYNSIPTWMNSGWAPDELADIVYGRKTFYNEDGSRMKVGRNDPCPCGSGKKYKNCCGK